MFYYLIVSAYGTLDRFKTFDEACIALVFDYNDIESARIRGPYFNRD